MSRDADTVQYRITVEYGLRYVYITLTDAAGNLVKDCEEVFSQPFLLSRKDAKDEASDAWHLLYDHVNETTVFPLPDTRGDASDSGEEK